MSDPNRIGGIRGPEGYTLADIISSLNNVVSGLGDVSSSLAQVVGRLDTAQSQNGSLVTLLTDLRNATGLVSQDPANYTVRRLLDEIHTCLCGPLDIDDGSGGGGEPPPPEDEPPANGCTGYARIQRVSYWQSQGTATISGTTYNVFAPMFSYDPTYQGWNLHSGCENTTRRAHIQNQGYNPIYYCLVWNFGLSSRPFAIARDVGGICTNIADTKTGLAVPFGHTWGTQVPNSGSFAEDFPSITSGNGPRFINWPFFFPVSISDPPRSAWLRYPVAG